MEIKTLSLSTFSRIPLSREFTRRESFDFDLLKPGKIPPPSPFPRDSFGSRGGKKKKREAASLLYQAAPSWKAPLHSNEDRWRTIGFSCLSLSSALASWHVNSNGERINLRPISSPLLSSAPNEGYIIRLFRGKGKARLFLRGEEEALLQRKR